MNARGFRSITVSLLLLGVSVGIMAASASKQATTGAATEEHSTSGN